MSDLTPKGFSNGKYVDRFLLRDKLYEEDAITMGGVAILNNFPAADAIEELQKAVNFHKFNSGFWEDKYNSLADEKWIPVTETENLPNGEVLALNNLKGSYGYHEYLVGYVCENRESETGFLCESDGVVLNNVTHWMPLPQPPKEET